MALNSQVNRIAGVDRYERSRLLAKEVEALTGVSNKGLASGANLPDALSAAPFLISKNYPLVLTSKLDDVLAGDYIFGGEAALAGGYSSQRLAGPDRY